MNMQMINLSKDEYTERMTKLRTNVIQSITTQKFNTVRK